MKKYGILIKYLPLIKADKIETFLMDDPKDKSSKNPQQFSIFTYSERVLAFISDIYTFEKQNSEMKLIDYEVILQKNHIKKNLQSIKNAPVMELDGECIMALIMGVARIERFSTGALLGCFRDGSIEKWLLRLQELDDSGNI